MKIPIWTYKSVQSTRDLATSPNENQNGLHIASSLYYFNDILITDCKCSQFLISKDTEQIYSPSDPWLDQLGLFNCEWPFGAFFHSTPFTHLTSYLLPSPLSQFLRNMINAICHIYVPLLKSYRLQFSMAKFQKSDFFVTKWHIRPRLRSHQ